MRFFLTINLFIPLPAFSIIFTLSLHDALPIFHRPLRQRQAPLLLVGSLHGRNWQSRCRSEEHTSELQSRGHLVCRLLLEKKNIMISIRNVTIISTNKQDQRKKIESNPHTLVKR